MPSDLLIVFFFQAEDGIRDLYVTGVQTCALPISERSPGSPIWHPKGMVIWNELEDIRRRENAKRGYDEIRTPLIYDNETWYTSGHFPKYEDLMFKLEVDGRPWAIKAMNCPGAL